MASVSVTELFRQVRGAVVDSEEAIWGDLDAASADMFCCMLESLAESEVQKRTGVKYRERGPARQDQRNGFRRRRVQGTYAAVTIRIPRLRGGGFVPSFLERGHRAISVVEGWVERAFLAGLQRCEIIRLMESVTGCRPSDSLIKRVQAKLDDLALAFRRRRLTGRYEYLFLDAAWVKDIVGDKARRICLLTAVGVTFDGRKEILGFERGRLESAAHWTRFLLDLVERGLDRHQLRMVISDEHKGIIKAVEDVLGDVPHQLCWAHRCRNVIKAVPKSDRKPMAESLRTIYQASNRVAAIEQFRRLKQRFGEQCPAQIACIEEDLGYLLAFLQCPALHQEYVRTSNPIERAFLELRRSRFGCGAFANRTSCDRVVANVFGRLNGLWAQRDIWMERTLRNKRKEEARAAEARKHAAASLSHCSDPVSGARGAPQQIPILPDGCRHASTAQTLVPA
jgi:transposase-like protein